MALQHFYIITNTDIINSLTASISNTCFKDLAIEYEKISFHYFITDINEWLENPKSFIFDIYEEKNSINDKPIVLHGQNKIIITNTDLMLVVQKLIINKTIPKIKYETLTAIKSITINDGVNNFRIVNSSMNEMTINDVQYKCNQAKIPFSN